MMARLRSAWLRFSGVLVLVLVLLHLTPLVPWAAAWLTDEWQAPKGDTLIVLGADQLGDGTLGVVSYWRSVYAVRAYREGGIRRIVVSGGKMGFPNASSLAGSMAAFMSAMGVPHDLITLEDRSQSTRENALYTAELVRNWPGSKVLMTSDCHMRRARAAFARAGLDTIPAPIPDIGKRWNSVWTRWDCIYTIAAELTKYAYYAARGWI